jgi:CTP synthase
MDIGCYERFLNKNLTEYHNITSGQIYRNVIEDEREGKYLGQCVQIIPHLTNEIKHRIRFVAQKDKADVVVVECGGTVGDIESLPFLEAFRQMKLEESSIDTLFVHVTLVPILDVVGEQKTKPTQHSVQELRRIGIQPDIIIARSIKPLSSESKAKISLFSSVSKDCVISNPDTESIYSVPELLASEGLIQAISKKMHLHDNEINWGIWKKISSSFIGKKDIIRIAMVGKYTTLADSYVTINNALKHAAAKLKLKVDVDWVESERFENNLKFLEILENYHGVLVPGGFGKRGIEGKILVANYTRENKIPYLGLCLGFQLAIISFARYVCGLKDANSHEFDPDTPYPVIYLMPEQRAVQNAGATMRLGGHDITLVKNSLAYKLYQSETIRERHRHRYEFNQEYRKIMEKKGIIFSGFSDDGKRTEIVEILNHPFFIATQYHAEYISRPGIAEPVFIGFLKASFRRKSKFPINKISKRSD